MPKHYLKLIILLILFGSVITVNAGNIGNTTGHAWLEKLGWISFSGAGASVGYGVTVGEAALSGYAWSEKTGWINFNDSGSYYGVTNDGTGNLSGYAWSEKLGYISFDDATANNYYQTTLADSVVTKIEKTGIITLRSGTILRSGTTLSPGQAETGLSYFFGYAWSEKGGYINMDDPGSLYKPSTEQYFACGTTNVKDIENNSYGTVQIGTQCWMSENMFTTTYPDGSPITKGCADHTTCGGTGPLLWGDDTALYSCPPNAANDGEDCTASSSLGLLYQWSAAMDGATASGSQGICPTGWHMPADWEWHILEDYLDEDTCDGGRDGAYDCDPAGSKLAGNDAADEDWSANTLTAHEDFDTSGFNAPPSGYRDAFSFYTNRSYDEIFWSSSEAPGGAWYRFLNLNDVGVYRNDIAKAYGFSVRCLKD